MHPSSSSNVQQPWHIDENIYPAIIAAENTNDDRPYRLVEGGALDYKRVQKLYDESPPPGYTIALVEVIYDQRMQERFEVELSLLEQRANENAGAPFKANWAKECASSEEKNSRQHILNHLVKRSQTPSGFRHVKVLPMFHATKQDVVDSIIRVGFTVLTKEGDFSDTGFYGKGIYHTSSAKYSYGVYGSDLILLYNWVSYFAAYPINDNESDWLNKHAGKEHYKNYDTHYVLVNSANPADPKEKYFYPIKGTEAHTYDELVTFQSNQILPRYIVHLEPTGLNLKQVPTKTDSIFDSILGLFSSKVELTVSTLIQEINNYLESKKRLEIEKSLVNLTKKRLETELKHKIETLLKRDSKAHLENEEAWLLRQLLCIQKNRNEKIAKILLSALCARVIPQDSNRTFVGLLQSYYNSRNSIPRLFRESLHIEQNYIQLVIVESSKETKNQIDKPKEIYKEERLSNWEDVQASKKPIQLNNLFDADKEGEDTPKQIAILGRAGIGKSTLCQYICYQWANGNLWNDKFKALIWIPLRQLIHAKDDDSLYDLVHRHCITPSGRKGLHPNQIREFLFKYDDKVLFVLDGYDEIASVLQEGTVAHDLMQELLQQKNWLLASRPYAYQGIKADRTLENVGFSTSDIGEYVTRSLPPRESQLLITEIQNHSWLSRIAHVPLNLELICSTWGEKTAFNSMSGLYAKFTLDLVRRFLKKRGIESAQKWEEKDYIRKYPSTLPFLEHLAWEGLQKQNLVISLRDKELKSVYLKYLPDDPEGRLEFEKVLLELGFLRSTGSSVHFEENEYEFSHLSFQEFFAARYICYLLQKEPVLAEELILLHKFNPQLQMVWWFVAGLLKEKVTFLNQFFELYDQAPDLVGLYGFQHKVRCLEECGNPKGLIENVSFKHPFNFWTQWLACYHTSEMLRNLFHSNSHRILLDLPSEIMDIDPSISNTLVPSFSKMLNLSSLNRQQAMDALGELLLVKGIHFTSIIPKLCSLVLKLNDEDILSLIKILAKAQKFDSRYEQLIMLELYEAYKKASSSQAHEVLGVIAFLLPRDNIDTFIPVAHEVLKQGAEGHNQTLRFLLAVVLKFPLDADKIIPLLLDRQYCTDAYLWKEIAFSLIGQLSSTPSLAKCIYLPFLKACSDKDILIRQMSLKVLTSIAKYCPDFVPQIVSELVNSITDSSNSIRELAARWYKNIFEDYPNQASKNVLVLSNALHDTDKNVCLTAATTLAWAMSQIPEILDEQKIMRMLEIFEYHLNEGHTNFLEDELTALIEIVTLTKSRKNKSLSILRNFLQHKSEYVMKLTTNALKNNIKTTPANASLLVPLLVETLSRLTNSRHILNISSDPAVDMRYDTALFLLSWLKYCPENISDVFAAIDDLFGGLFDTSSSYLEKYGDGVLEQLCQALLSQPIYLGKIIPWMLRSSNADKRLMNTLMKVFKILPSKRNEIMEILVNELSQGYENLYNYENSKISEKRLRIKIFAKDLADTPEVTSIEPFITFFLTSNSPDLRARTVFCLAKILEADSRHLEPLRPILKDALQDRQKPVRLSVARALAPSLKKWPDLSEAIITELSDLINHEDYSVRIDALCCFLTTYQSKTTHNQKSLAALIKGLRNQDKNTRFIAACILASCLSDCLNLADEIVMTLINRLNNKHQLHKEAIFSLGNILKQFPQFSKQIVPEFLNILESQDDVLLRVASSYFIDVFKHSPENQEKILNALEVILKKKAEFLYFWVINLITEIAKTYPKFMSRISSWIILLLNNKDEYVRKDAAKSLGELIRHQPSNLSDMTGILLDYAKKEKSFQRYEFEKIFQKFDWSTRPLTIDQLVSFMSIATAQCLEATSFENLIRSASKDIANRDQYLRVIIIKCIEEKVPIFFHKNSICFYKNGLQIVTVDQAQEVAERLNKLSKQFPVEFFQYIIKNYKIIKKRSNTERNANELDSMQNQVEEFKKLNDFTESSEETA